MKYLARKEGLILVNWTIFAWLLKLTQKRSFDYDKMFNYLQKADLRQSDDFRLEPPIDSETQNRLRQAM